MRFGIAGLAFSLLASDLTTSKTDWEPIGPEGGSVHVLAIDPARTSVILAATRNGLLFRSEDQARNWSPLPLPRFPGVTIHALLIDPKRNGTYFVGLNDPNNNTYGGLWRSDDSGLHWRRVESLAGRSVLSLAIRDTEPRLFAAGTDQGVFLSDSQGDSWRAISPADNLEIKGIVSLAFDPREPDTLYAGTTHLPWKTSDRGATWNSVHDGMLDDSDVFSLLTDRERAGRVYASACSGIYSSTDGGAKWQRAKGIPPDNRRTYIITQDREYPNLLYAGTTAGLWKSADSGLTWKKLHDAQVNSLAVDPYDGRVMYIATDGGGVLKSVDAGRSWVARNHGLVNRAISSALFAPAGLYATTMYEGLYGGVFLLPKGKPDWTLIANQPKLKGENIRQLRASANRLIGNTFSGRISSADGGKTWVVIPGKPNEANLPSINGAPAFDLATLPPPHRVQLASHRDGLFRSADAGKTWVKLTKGLPEGFIRSVACHPTRIGHCLALQAANLYASSDSGQTWRMIGSSTVTAASLSRLLIDPSADRTIYAVSSDQGLYRRQIMAY